MPAAVTEMDEVVSPVLHSNVPVAVVDKAELAQLFVTVTVGADGIAIGVAMTVPEGLAHPLTVCVTE